MIWTRICTIDGCWNHCQSRICRYNLIQFGLVSSIPIGWNLLKSTKMMICPFFNFLYFISWVFWRFARHVLKFRMVRPVSSIILLSEPIYSPRLIEIPFLVRSSKLALRRRYIYSCTIFVSSYHRQLVKLRGSFIQLLSIPSIILFLCLFRSIRDYIFHPKGKY